MNICSGRDGGGSRGKRSTPRPACLGRAGRVAGRRAGSRWAGSVEGVEEGVYGGPSPQHVPLVLVPPSRRRRPAASLRRRRRSLRTPGRRRRGRRGRERVGGLGLPSRRLQRGEDWVNLPGRASWSKRGHAAGESSGGTRIVP
jgi:hypothetical protein